MADIAWKSGDAYEAYVGRWSRRVAEIFVDWLGVPAGRRWLDAGCGTGALSSQLPAPSLLVGVDSSQGFLSTAPRILPTPQPLPGAPQTLREAPQPLPGAPRTLPGAPQVL